MAEGGEKLLDSLIKDNYWDEARVFTASKEFGEGIKMLRSFQPVIMKNA